MYYPATHRLGTFVVWDNRRKTLTQDELVTEVERFTARMNQDVLVVLNYELTRPIRQCRLIHKFDRSIVEDERYWLYRVERIR